MNLVTAFSKALLIGVRGAELINEVDQILESKEFNGLKTASLASRTSLLFLGVLEVALAAANQSYSKAGVIFKGRGIRF